MNGKVVLASILMAVGAGVAGWSVGCIQAEKKNQKDWKKVSDSVKESLKVIKEKWPDAWESVMKEHENDYDEEFKKELEEL